MMINLECEHCSRRLKIPEKFQGRRIKCPVCRKTIAVVDSKEESDFTKKIEVKSSAADLQATTPKIETALTDAQNEVKLRPQTKRDSSDNFATHNTDWLDWTVATLMVGLWCSYFLMIALIVALVLIYAVFNYENIVASTLGDEASFVIFLLHLGTIAIGIGIAFFQLKPLLAKKENLAFRLVRRKNETILFDLFDQISRFFQLQKVDQLKLDNSYDVACRPVDYNRPTESGLVVELGMPVLANLNQQQAAALMAMEMIEKSIEVNSPVALVIRKTHEWFFRGAHLRDTWDHRLSRMRSRSGIFTTFFASILQLSVFLNRRVFWFFYLFSRVISGIAIRRYYRKALLATSEFVGSEAIIDGYRKNQIANRSFYSAVKKFIDSYLTYNPIDDIAGLVETERKQMPDADALAMKMKLEKQWTRPWSSRPSLLWLENQFRSNEKRATSKFFGSAKQLFRNFKSTSRQTTIDVHNFLVLGDFVQVRDGDRRNLNIALSGKLPTGMTQIEAATS